MIPRAMVAAAIKGAYGGVTGDLASSRNIHFHADKLIEAAIRWLAENPIIPSSQWLQTHPQYAPGATSFAIEWQRDMFLAPSERLSSEQQQIWMIECQNDRGEWLLARHG